MTGRQWFGLLCGAAAAVVAASSVLRVNISPSVPEGLYVVVSRDVKRGAYVEMCQPEWIRKLTSTREEEGRCPDGSMTSIKPVAAVAGDVVVTSAEGIEVNGVQIPNSRALPGIPRVADGRYVVASGDVWLISHHHPASIDSRYYGGQPTAIVLRQVAPIYTW